MLEEMFLLWAEKQAAGKSDLAAMAADPNNVLELTPEQIGSAIGLYLRRLEAKIKKQGTPKKK